MFYCLVLLNITPQVHYFNSVFWELVEGFEWAWCTFNFLDHNQERRGNANRKRHLQVFYECMWYTRIPRSVGDVHDLGSGASSQLEYRFLGDSDSRARVLQGTRQGCGVRDRGATSRGIRQKLVRYSCRGLLHCRYGRTISAQTSRAESYAHYHGSTGCAIPEIKVCIKRF